MIWLQTYGAIGESLQSLADAGVFDYVLPFLLIFAIIYGLLSKIEMFGDNRAVPMIIGLTIGLLSLVDGRVPAFFHEIFPSLGIGIAIIITGLILLGVFVPLGKDDWGNYIFIFVGVVIFLVVVLSSLSNYNIFDMWWFERYWPGIIAGLFVVLAVVWMVLAGKSDNDNSKKKRKGN